MNEYLTALNRIEFIVTYACTGSCKHCSEGDHLKSGCHIDPRYAKQAILDIADRYSIDSVMTFGGEPLLYPESVKQIHLAAKQANIPRRQLITNGYFSGDNLVIKSVASQLAEWGINDILLSVDAFHQETIPLEAVKLFASEVKAHGGHIRTSPAWLVSKQDDNAYNIRTREILEEFTALHISQAEGNVIFPEGNALVYLKEYFDESHQYQNPYVEDPLHIKSVSIEPSGTLFGKCIYIDDVVDILENYSPQ